MPGDSGPSESVRQNRLMPRLPVMSMLARSCGVPPGMPGHGSSRPDASSSPTPLPRVVENEQSEMVIDQENEGTSTGCANWPVIVS